MMKPILGVYGGTFSPPHLGHEYALQAFLHYVRPAETLIIPSRIPPHKELPAGVTDQDRIEMCKLAFGRVPYCVVSDMEMKRKGPSYTADTICQLRNPYRDIAFLVGTDMMLTIHEWFHPERIFDFSTVYCVRRENDPEMTAKIKAQNERLMELYGKQVIMIPVPAYPLSSSQIRLGKYSEPEKCVAPAVSEYIRKRGLYK